MNAGTVAGLLVSVWALFGVCSLAASGLLVLIIIGVHRLIKSFR